MTVRVTPEFRDAFAALAEREHRSVEGQMRYVMERAVETDEEATT